MSDERLPGLPVHLKGSEPQGYIALVLHAHLPFIRHRDNEQQLEEEWLYEALTETYIPLLNMMLRLRDEGVPFQLSLSITPTLAHMLDDELLISRYVHRLELLMELAEKEVERTRWHPRLAPLAQMYRDLFRHTYTSFVYRFGRRLLPHFRSLQESGHLEILASAATHGYLPLMDLYPEAVRAQIEVGLESYRRAFGRPPVSFWLPECGYTPVADRLLAKTGVRATFLDSHGLLFGKPRPRYAVYAPIYSPTGLACFGRDWESSQQVWSADEGYPGDPAYREFYRDIGWDLDFEYLRPYLKGNFRHALGIKYHRVTARGNADKDLYDPQAARERAAVHAGNFLFNRERQIEFLRTRMEQPPVVLAPYDAELFGHWWWEGPIFLEYFLRRAAYDQVTIATITPGTYLGRYKRHQVVSPSVSSWGYKGYHEVWLEGSNDWIYRHLYQAAERMIEWAMRLEPDGAAGDQESWRRRALNQAARELLLAQSSDWAFILKTGTVVEYARLRFAQHVQRFNRLIDMVEAGQVDPEFVADLESQDNLFPWLDYRLYRTDALPRELQFRSFAERCTGGPYPVAAAT
ncbi:MAG: DUF1957 domain-containing protein [Limnochordales bacterium]|nr:DUF1957 domain-containing protein [Limnochordales bacterium]